MKKTSKKWKSLKDEAYYVLTIRGKSHPPIQGYIVKYLNPSYVESLEEYSGEHQSISEHLHKEETLGTLGIGKDDS